MSIIFSLAEALNKKEFEIKNFLYNAPQKYKVYSIPKRTYGYRKIAQPSKELKIYQKAFLNLYNFPSHHCAVAYKKNLSIKDNADLHKNNSYLLKMDFKDFFNSITPRFFWNSIEHVLLESSYQIGNLANDLSQLLNLNNEEKRYVEALLFWSKNKKVSRNLVLSIGAPTSPVISNFCLYTFDKDVEDICKKYHVIYSRYADDIFFSTNERDILFQFPKLINNILYKRFGNKLQVNNNKTIFSSKAHNRHITGITISNCNKLSLGREKKRYIKHLIYQFTLNNLDSSNINHLRGLISYANHIEPQFILNLEKKYTINVLREIKEVKSE